jgi:hypothetical protein
LTNVIEDPLKSLVYILYIVLAYGYLSKLWIDVGGNGPKDVAR